MESGVHATTAATKFLRGSLSPESNAAAFFAAVGLLQSFWVLLCCSILGFTLLKPFGFYSAEVFWILLYCSGDAFLPGNGCYRSFFLGPNSSCKLRICRVVQNGNLVPQNVLQKATLKHNLVLASSPFSMHQLSFIVKIDQ